jgi:anthranilate synthase, component I (EC 4.1.3.27)
LSRLNVISIQALLVTCRWHGCMDMAIAIRTAVIKDETLYVQAGAGIVYDSVPQSEWDETMHKARALIKAAEQV